MEIIHLGSTSWRMEKGSSNNWRSLELFELHRHYKVTFSIVLLAIVLLYIHVRCGGRISDGRVYRNSPLCDAIQNDLLNILKPWLWDDGETVFLYVIVGDHVFPLKEDLMKPYPFGVLESKISEKITAVIIAVFCTTIYGRKYRFNTQQLKLLIVRISKMGNRKYCNKRKSL